MASTVGDWRERIVSTPGICGGRARIAGTRITVSVILDNLAAKLIWNEIIEEYPQLKEQDISAVLQYHSHIYEGRKLKKIIFDKNSISTIPRKFVRSREILGLDHFFFESSEEIETDIKGIRDAFEEVITKENVVKKLNLLIDLLSESEEISLEDFILYVLFFYGSADELEVATDKIGRFVKKYYKNSLPKLKTLENMMPNQFFEIQDNKFFITEIGMNHGALRSLKFMNRLG